MKFTFAALLLTSAAAERAGLRVSSAGYYDDDDFVTRDAGECVGREACDGATGTIGDESCLGFKACKDASGNIGSKSCTADNACKGSTAAIGTDSCTTMAACADTSSSIGDMSCSDGDFACYESTAFIGTGACNGDKACDGAEGLIGDMSCSYQFACKDATSSSSIGNNSCLAFSACKENSGTIGDNSCNGYEACVGNTEDIPANCPSLSEFNLGRCDGSGGNGMTLAQEQAAGNARWILRAMPWGGFTTFGDDPTVNKDDPMFRSARALAGPAPLFANAIPFASDHATGRIFFYLNGYHDLPGATLTVSQGGVNPELFAIAGCGTSPDSIVDIQEPQCTKLSVSGDAYHCGHKGDKEECMSTGKAALFAVHPTMADWDAEKYMVHELYPREDGFWMINFYGGNSGTLIDPESFAAVSEEYIIPHDVQGGYSYEVPAFAEEPLPEDPATRARWIEHNALYATVSTIDHNFILGEHTFGNPRSMTDGQSLALSTGTPIFVCPDEDATALDLAAHDNQLALSFSEGQIFGRVTDDGVTCGGGSCAEVVLYGAAEALDVDSDEYAQALKDFEVTHPLGDWLWSGGSHMSSKYYLVKPYRIELRDSPDQAAQSIDVDEYLGVTFSGDEAEKVRKHKLVKNEGYVALAE